MQSLANIKDIYYCVASYEKQPHFRMKFNYVSASIITLYLKKTRVRLICVLGKLK